MTDKNATTQTPVDHLDAINMLVMQMKGISQLIRGAFSHDDFTPSDTDMTGVTYALDSMAEQIDTHAETMFHIWKDMPSFPVGQQPPHAPGNPAPRICSVSRETLSMLIDTIGHMERQIEIMQSVDSTKPDSGNLYAAAIPALAKTALERKGEYQQAIMEACGQLYPMAFGIKLRQPDSATPSSPAVSQ
jgi:hypothetical protein